MAFKAKLYMYEMNDGLVLCRRLWVTWSPTLAAGLKKRPIRRWTFCINWWTNISTRWRPLQSLSRYKTKFIHLQMRVSIFLTFTGIQRHYILFSVYTCTCRNVNGNFVLICKIWFVISSCLLINTRTFHASILLEDFIFIICLVLNYQ